MTMQPAVDTKSIEIPLGLQESWQKTVDLIAETIQVPAALVMRSHYREIEVFVASDSDGNPYQRGEKAALKTGLYCETVMANRERLLVRDALHDPNWDHNPDLALNMISYMGWPIVWPNGDIFGTICVLDNKPNAYDEVKSALLYQFKELIEFSLRSIYDQLVLDTGRDQVERLGGQRQHSRRPATIDDLTGLNNRRAVLDIASKQFSQLHQTDAGVALYLIDVDHLKKINDRHGRQIGDQALAATARLLEQLSRPADTLGRYGGDEFMLLAPEISADDARAFAERIVDSARNQPIKAADLTIPLTLSLGAFTCRPADQTFESALRHADEALMAAKSQGRDRAICRAQVGPPPEDTR